MFVSYFENLKIYMFCIPVKEIHFFNHTWEFFNFYLVVSAATAVSYDSTEIYRRRLAGYAVVTTTVQEFIVVVSAGTAVSYDSAEIYQEDKDDDEEGAK